MRFLDFVKGPHHGERYRHDAVEAARSDAIFYLCDDDLLLPDHVADLLALLKDHNLVQSLNGYVDPLGRVSVYAADLSDPETVAMHLRDDVRFNAVSITGTAHSRSFYLESDQYWDTTPAGEWPDHHQWRRLMRQPSFRGATSPRMTALQFPTSADGRDTWTPAERHAEVEPWQRLVSEPDGQERVDEAVRRGTLVQLEEERRAAVLIYQDWALARRQVAQLQADALVAQHLYEAQLASATDAHRQLGETLDRAEDYRLQLVTAQEQVALLREKVARLRTKVGRDPKPGT